MVTIYGLVCPLLGEVRYIGKTKNDPNDRLKGHLSDARTYKYNHYAARWLRKLLSEGLIPGVVVLESVEQDWEEAEVRWIAKGKALGWPLTNSTIGGDGAPEPTPEMLAKKRETMEKVWERPEFIQKMKDARNDPVFIVEQADRLKVRWRDQKARDKMMARWTPEAKAKQSAAIKARHAKIQAAMTPEVRAKQGAALRATWAKRKAAKSC